MYERWKKPLIVIAIILSLFAAWGLYFLSTHTKDETFGWLRMVKSPTCSDCMIVADELLMKFEDGVVQNEIKNVVNAVGGNILDLDAELNVYRIRISDANALEATQEKLEMDPRIKFVIYNNIYDIPQ